MFKNLTIKLSGKITHTFFIHKTFGKKNNKSGSNFSIFLPLQNKGSSISVSMNLHCSNLKLLFNEKYKIAT